MCFEERNVLLGARLACLANAKPDLQPVYVRTSEDLTVRNGFLGVLFGFFGASTSLLLYTLSVDSKRCWTSRSSCACLSAKSRVYRSTISLLCRFIA